MTYTNVAKTKAVAAVLRDHPEWSSRRIACSCGVAHPKVSSIRILNREAIYEVALHLTRARLYEAMGQVLLYQKVRGIERRAYIFCGSYTSTIPGLIGPVQALGFEVIRWKNAGLVPVSSAAARPHRPVTALSEHRGN